MRGERGEAATHRVASLRRAHGHGPARAEGGWLPEPTPPERDPESDPAPEPKVDPEVPAAKVSEPGLVWPEPAVATRGSADPAAGRGVAGLRGQLLDRVPSGRPIPARAVVAALVLALAVAVGMLARSVTGGATELAIPVASSPTAGAASPSAGLAVNAPPAGGSRYPTPTPVGGPASDAPSGAVLVVDIVGRVRHPGLVRIAAGSRVSDAVAAAGGAVPGAALDRINLARPLVDGEQVLVPGPGDPLVAGPAGGSGSSVSGSGVGGSTGSGGSTSVDLNAASEAQLDALPGVGPVLAGRIVAWRTAHAHFSRIEELGEVPGIGPKMLERLRPMVHL